MPHITPNLWFSTPAEEAVQHYIDALGDGAVRSVLHYGPEALAFRGTVMTVYFELFDQPCGWLTDRYGVAWQVTPDRLHDLLNVRRPRGGPAGHPGHAGDVGSAVRHQCPAG